MTVNYWAVGLAAVASFLFGALWYGLLGRHWLAALGKTDEELKASAGFMTPMVVTFIAEMVMAWVLAGVMAHLLKGGVAVGVRNGVLTAALLWVGFVATTLASNNAFQGQRRMLTVIDGGHWLGVMLIQGAIIAGWALR